LVYIFSELYILLSKIIPIVLYILLTASCSTFDRDDLGRHVSDPVELAVGDIIRVVTVDIEDFRFRFTGITEQAIEGQDISIPFVEIRDIEVITPIRSSSSSWDNSEGTSEDISETAVVVYVIITVLGLILANPSTDGTSYYDIFPE
jgi:hypothetical protein